MAHHMSEYRAYLIGEDGHFFEAVPLICTDDNEASEQAKRLADGHGVELWQRDRKVALFEHTPAKQRCSVTHEIHDGRMIPKPAK
jgi:hypothetical protein